MAAELDDVHGESASSLKTVGLWVNEFERGRITTKNEVRSGRPIEVTTSDMVEKNSLYGFGRSPNQGAWDF